MAYEVNSVAEYFARPGLLTRKYSEVDTVAVRMNSAPRSSVRPPSLVPSATTAAPANEMAMPTQPHGRRRSPKKTADSSAVMIGESEMSSAAAPDSTVRSPMLRQMW